MINNNKIKKIKIKIKINNKLKEIKMNNKKINKDNKIINYNKMMKDNWQKKKKEH